MGMGINGVLAGVETEQARVASHILRAEARAGGRRVRLRPLQRVARALLLRELAVYRARRLFPKNRDFAAPTPYFVDAEGTRCAVAHLLDASGEGAFVQRIAQRRNHARVAELADEARLVAWLDAAGLSLDEAALIQPSYCYRPDSRDCICEWRQSGYFEVEKTSTSSAEYSLARVNVVHGKPAETVIQVGDYVRVGNSQDLEIGTVMLLPGEASHDDGVTTFSVPILPPYSCGEGTPELSKEQYLQAALADDCKATLDSFGHWEREQTCDGCGCRAAGGGHPTTFGIVLSLLGLAIARRMRQGSR